MKPEELLERLAEPFEVSEVKWKAQVVKGSRALAVAYVDARIVAQRLDDVFGIDGWQDSYQVLPNNSVICRLRVKVGSEWIEKTDVGSPSEQPDQGDRVKSAFSDALKRAAVKLGIGRYLYKLPQQWVDYDAPSKTIAQPPRLPEWAYPKEREAWSVGREAWTGSRPTPHAPRPTDEEPRITREQWELIRASLVENRVSQRKFLAHYRIQKPGELKAQDFEEALHLAQHPHEEWLTRGSNGVPAA